MLQVKVASLEQLACSVQSVLKTQKRGELRNQMIAQLARLDQVIAGYKDLLKSGES